MAFGRRSVTIILAVVLGLGLAATIQVRASAHRAKRPGLLFVQAPVIRAGRLSERFPQGSRIVYLANESPSPANLTPEFFAAADPQISFDGTQVLFAGRKESGTPWQIWEMNADGSAKRQLTRGASDCLRPAYLPRDEIVFTVAASEVSGSASQLYVSKRDGSEAHPITFGPGDFQVETVLRNGLILATARSPLLPAGRPDSSRELYTVRPDGSGLASFRCEHGQRAIRADAEELENGSVVFVKNAPSDLQVGGELAQIRRGALHNSVISPLRVVSWSPRRLNGEELIVARKAVGSGPSGAKFDLYAFDSAGGKFGEPLYQDPKLSSVQAAPLAAHPAPRWYWSTLNPSLQVGYFICLDSYRALDAPKGRISTPIAKVRVLSLDLASRQESTLGEAPVERDGSFYIAVPPDQPVRFVLLDERGHVVRAQRSWIWARSGDEHGCAGCHEDKAAAPENRWPLTLRRFDTPTRLGVPPAAQAAH
jgi:hypothetical protein